jgi:hypothetical protein
MAEIIRLHQTSPEKVIARLPAPDDLVEIVAMYRSKTGGTQFALSEMKIETLAYYICELQREYHKMQTEQGF